MQYNRDSHAKNIAYYTIFCYTVMVVICKRLITAIASNSYTYDATISLYNPVLYGAYTKVRCNVR